MVPATWHPTQLFVNIHIYMRTYVCTYKHTCIQTLHAYTLTYVKTYTHVHTQSHSHTPHLHMCKQRIFGGIFHNLRGLTRIGIGRLLSWPGESGESGLRRWPGTGVPPPPLSEALQTALEAAAALRDAAALPAVTVPLFLLALCQAQAAVPGCSGALAGAR